MANQEVELRRINTVVPVIWPSIVECICPEHRRQVHPPTPSNEALLLDRNGVTVGSHTATHPDLTTLSDAQALAELRTSRHVLERHLKRPVLLSTLRAALRRAGDGPPTVSTHTIWRTLRAAGLSWQKTRTWCDTGVVRRRRGWPYC